MPTILKVFTFNAFSENTYVLSDSVTKETLIFDPGCYTINEKKMLKKYVDDNNLMVKRLINTHCHLDHVFGNTYVMETYGVELEAHKNEISVLERAHIAGDMFGVPMPPQDPPTVFIEDNAVIEIGSIKLKTILAPGHSPGSLCFYNENEKYIIGGDVLFRGSIGRSDLPGGNHQQLIKSIVDRLMVLPEDVKVYSGHGPATSIGFEKYNNPFLV
jgi:hydroxyacylglutathione hydrolase